MWGRLATCAGLSTPLFGYPMKFSYSWIRSLVDGLDIPAEALERLITMKTAECEGVETVGQLLARTEAVAATVESRQNQFQTATT